MEETGKVDAQSREAAKAGAQIRSEDLTEKEERLRSYLERVNGGEDLETVRSEFAREFQDVPVMDIMHTEQKMLQDGVDSRKMKKLCDLHSALFHGRSEGEVISEQSRLKKINLSALPEGHPVQYFVWENSALEQLVTKIRFLAETPDEVLHSEMPDAVLHPETPGEVSGQEVRDEAGLTKTEQELLENLLLLKKIRTLYSKKEELLMPRLERYGVVGPTQVMWPVDDEIKREVSRIARELPQKGLSSVREDLLAVLKRITEMIYKDENILLPVSLKFFTEDEWIGIYRDEYEMGPVFAREIPRWKEAEEKAVKETAGKTPAAETSAIVFDGDEVTSPAGRLTIPQLKGLLKVLPVDITFIDPQPANRFYKNTDKVFSRPLTSLNQSTYLCHPAQLRPVVEKLLDDFRSGKKDSFERYIPNPQRPVRVLYLAVRDEEGNYLGAAEIVQDLTGIRNALLPMDDAKGRFS